MMTMYYEEAKQVFEKNVQEVKEVLSKRLYPPNIREEKGERIYVAGPYSPQNHEHNFCVGQAEANVRNAIWFGNELVKKGHVVFVPHLSHYQANAVNGNHNWPWYEIDNTFIDNWATALYYMGPSKGADAELERAKKLGLKVYYHLEEVPTVNGGRA